MLPFPVSVSLSFRSDAEVFHHQLLNAVVAVLVGLREQGIQNFVDRVENFRFALGDASSASPSAP